MSCQTNYLKAGQAALNSGISSLSSLLMGTAGRLAGGLTRKAGQGASGALAIIESFEGPTSLDSLGAVAVVVDLWGALPPRTRPAATRSGDAASPNQLDYALGPATMDEDIPAWLKQGMETHRAKAAQQAGRRYYSSNQQHSEAVKRVRQRALLALAALKLGQTTGMFAGTGLGRLSRQGELEQRFFFPQSTKLPVRVWSSRLTPLLNRAAAGLHPIKVGTGRMFETRGQTWHRGTIVVKTTGGERTITHLQQLSLPASHIFFNRPLSDTETVGIISGQKGFDPKHMEGYAGQISDVEALAPTWAAAKRSLIQATLLWAEPDQKATGRPTEPVYPLEQVGDRVRLNGQEYPVIVTKIVSTPNRGQEAQAAYYDSRAAVWREVVDPELKAQLARQVAQGQIELWNEDNDELQSKRD